MRLWSLPAVIGFLAVHVGVTAAACSSNNCLRAVRGESFPSRPTRADCSSFMLTTVTPATSIITRTATATVPLSTTKTDLTSIETFTTATATITLVNPTTTTIHPTIPVLEARQVTVRPSSIPAYASPCTSAAAYSSACSCIGITGSTTTAPTPISYTTMTITISPTVTLSTLATVTLSRSTTTSTTTTTSPTATATGLPAGAFRLQLSGGRFSGRFLHIVFSNSFRHTGWLTIAAASSRGDGFALSSPSSLLYALGGGDVAALWATARAAVPELEFYPQPLPEAGGTDTRELVRCASPALDGEALACVPQTSVRRVEWWLCPLNGPDWVVQLVAPGTGGRAQCDRIELLVRYDA